MKLFTFTSSKKYTSIDPDEIFIDAFNVSSFDRNQFEGQVEKPISQFSILFVGVFFLLILSLYIFQVYKLQVLQGGHFASLSEQNRLKRTVVFAERGVIKDRYLRSLAWNEQNIDVDDVLKKSGQDIFSKRVYRNAPGTGHLLGFINYPETDSSGNWWRTEFEPQAGVEFSFDKLLKGVNGSKIIEVDAMQEMQSQSVVEFPIKGNDLVLSIDLDISKMLFESIKNGALRSGFVAGSGVIMDVKTGEVLALSNYPEYSPQILTDGTDRKKIAEYSLNNRKPFLNRAVAGSYTPGSIIKPYMASVALQEGVITPQTKILSTGVLKIPNPYHPGKFSTFHDWRKGFGWLDVREAIKMSSSIFFYVVGGGFENQEGLGIERITKWAKEFGFGNKTGIKLHGERSGVVPSPEWKKETFGDNAEWNLGNTYHSSIGQYGWLVTPIQAVRYISSIANGGSLYKPQLQKGLASNKYKIPVDDKHMKVVREGMRRGARAGTAQALNIQGITLSAKTGTAQLGRHNEFMNSWVVGFWPYEDPQFAFAVVLEKAKAETLVGAAPAMRPFFEWLSKNEKEYASGKYPEKLNEVVE